MEKIVRNSVKALIIGNDKMLALRIRDLDGEFYILPGGGQKSEELLTECVCREVAEETGILSECGELLFVIEGLYGEKFHRVDLVFLCKYIDNIPEAVPRRDKNQISYDWLDIAALITQRLYPSKLRRQIINYYEGKPYKVYFGNEEMGDPECLD